MPHWRKALAAAIGLTLLSAVIALVASGDDGDLSTVAAKGESVSTDPADLLHRDWEIADVTIDGEGWTPPPGRSASLWLSDGRVGATFCNGSAGPVDLGPGTIRLAPDRAIPGEAGAVGSTAAACDPDGTSGDAALAHLLQRMETWSVQGSTARIEGRGVRATLRETTVGAPEGMDLLASHGLGTRTPQWVIAFAETGPDTGWLWLGGRSGPGEGFGSAGLAIGTGADLEPMPAFGIGFEDGRLLIGGAPGGTASVRYDAEGRSWEVPLFDLSERVGAVAFGGFLHIPPGGLLLALDAEGAELARTPLRGG